MSFFYFFPRNNCIVLSFQTCITLFIYLFIYLLIYIVIFIYLLLFTYYEYNLRRNIESLRQ